VVLKPNRYSIIWKDACTEEYGHFLISLKHSTYCR
jgi:hypothetical protein